MKKYLLISGKFVLVILTLYALLFLYTAFNGYFLKKESNSFSGTLLLEVSKGWDMDVMRRKFGSFFSESSLQEIKTAGDALGKIVKCKTKKADIQIRALDDTLGEIRNFFDCSFEKGQADVVIDLEKNRDGSWSVKEFQIQQKQRYPSSTKLQHSRSAD